MRGYPIGFRELAQLYSNARWSNPALILFAVTSIALGVLLLQASVSDGVLFGLKLAGLLLVSRFIFVACAFSSGTNDTSRIRVRSVVLSSSWSVCGWHLSRRRGQLVRSQTKRSLGFYGIGCTRRLRFLPGYGWFSTEIASI